MRAAYVLVGITAGIAGGSCATVSGLADYDVVDCPGGCADVIPDGASAAETSVPATDAANDVVVDSGQPCDPSNDAECMQLPAGWSLVARAPVADTGAPPPCPAGMGSPSAVFESPSARSNTCACGPCNVTGQASCSGALTYSFGNNAACGTAGSSNYANPTAGQCANDLYTGTRFSSHYRFKLPDATGGSCQAGAATVQANAFDVTNRATLCDDQTRCSGGTCNARFDAPFATCVAKAGTDPCPAGFADRHVVGTSATADCAKTCSCTVVRGACAGSVNHYTDANCTNGLDAVTANDTCLVVNWAGESFGSYKVVASAPTTCTSGGTPSASNARLVNPRTVCCR